ncbi:MAG: DUF3604 domain-containing protein [Clostridia bacterium]|nr:DUF3604 domain-containing protein [Clostridia bacterium]
MKHPERKLAKCFDMPGRSAAFTDIVYSGERGSWDKIREDQRNRLPGPPQYSVYFGDLHGHTNLSDGRPEIDDYFIGLRDRAELDFGAVSDHDHGGVGKPELWNAGKWDLIRQKVKEYYEPGKFTTILAYERDSYPYYNNLVVYYRTDDGELLRGVRDGEITREELRRWLAREDLILVPHDTNYLSSGADFLAMEPEDMVPLIQVFGGTCAEYMGDPTALMMGDDCEGGHWQDALRRGARMGCIACSDSHSGKGGLTTGAFPTGTPGITGVWAEENTREAIFSALKARRCYGFTGGRITVDFRIDGHYMGEEITAAGDPALYYNVEADAPVETVTIVKNCRDYIILRRKKEQLVYDYRQEQETDCYYLRVKLADGRLAWTSPIWVSRAE